LDTLDASDEQGILGALEGAVGDLQDAVTDGLFAPAGGARHMGELAGIARELAEDC
jgi:hypothetical protein